MSAYRRVSYVGVVLFILGGGVAVYGFTFWQKTQNLKKNGIRTKGTVYEIGSKAIYRFPFVKFTTKKGEEIRFRSKLEVNVDLFNYKIGQEVDVIYHKYNPHNARIDKFWENNMAELYLTLLGVIIMFVGLMVRWFFIRKVRREARY
ncbi:DUF3592 domain-containing protein [uncultured Microscilla sp.]|uniref:DUF3592 domain-containing protein n=1 Tax=uncultured Microscilla sp. TaxID=432653 RepID=UPI00262DD9FD|nr:DUF3592 domain-containing protein [uncultured Microscilla sp.]